MRNGKPRASKNIEVEKSCGNVFADLGFENAEELLLHAKLVSRLTDVIRTRRLSIARAASILQVKRADLSKLLDGDLDRYPTETLFRFLNSLDQQVDIVIRPRAKGDNDACTEVVAV